MLLKLHDTCSADAVINFHTDNIKMSSACPASACKTGNKAGAPAPLIQRRPDNCFRERVTGSLKHIGSCLGIVSRKQKVFCFRIETVGQHGRGSCPAAGVLGSVGKQTGSANQSLLLLVSTCAGGCAAGEGQVPSWRQPALAAEQADKAKDKAKHPSREQKGFYRVNSCLFSAKRLVC